MIEKLLLQIQILQIQMQILLLHKKTNRAEFKRPSIYYNPSRSWSA